MRILVLSIRKMDSLVSKKLNSGGCLLGREQSFAPHLQQVDGRIITNECDLTDRNLLFLPSVLLIGGIVYP